MRSAEKKRVAVGYTAGAADGVSIRDFAYEKEKKGDEEKDKGEEEKSKYAGLPSGGRY